jgi:uncharacterized membrane protein YhaH (DUF805 family)
VTFFESISTVFRKYADFNGRATRPEYWWFTLFVFVTSAIMSAIDPTMSEGTFGISAGLSTAWSLALLLPHLAVAIRRLRDTGRNWTNIFWLLVPIAGPIVVVVYLAQPSIPEYATENP